MTPKHVEIFIGAIAAACVTAVLIIGWLCNLKEGDYVSLFGAAFGAAAAALVAIWVEDRKRTMALADGKRFLLEAIEDARTAVNDAIELSDAPVGPDQQMSGRAVVQRLIASFETIDSLKATTALVDLDLLRRSHLIAAAWKTEAEFIERVAKAINAPLNTVGQHRLSLERLRVAIG